MDDIVDDVPLLYTFVGIMIAHLIECGGFQLNKLNDVFGNAMSNPSKMRLLGETLKFYQEKFGVEALTGIFKGVALKGILPSGTTEDNIVAWKKKFHLVTL